MKTTLIILVILVLLVGGGWLLWNSGIFNYNLPQTAAPVYPGMVSAPTQTGPVINAPVSSSPKNTTNGVTVDYTSNGFSPSTITVTKGGTVTWVNNSQDVIRVASDPHPTHNGYPTTGGCVSSTFDSCSLIPPGGTWSFTFGIVGTWGYHNHMNPVQKGTVVVQ